MSSAPHDREGFLPDAEWKFGRLDEWLAPGEWTVFLNYEYGRIYRPLVEDVLRLRDAAPISREVGTQPDQRPGLAAAKFWARYFPEFPAHPYSALAREERRRRLDRLGLDSLADPNRANAVYSHDPDVFFFQIAVGDLSLDEGLRRRLMILELKPTRSKKVLRQQVLELADKKFASLQKGDGQFRPLGADARGSAGQKRNGRVVDTFTKNLAALRLVSSHGWDWRKAANYAQSRRSQVYANKQYVWERAYRSALYLLRRFEAAWKRCYWPEFVLDPSRFSHQWSPALSRPFLSQDEAAVEASLFERELRPKILSHELRSKLLMAMKAGQPGR